MADSTPLQVVITGGGGGLARALIAALPGDTVLAPPRTELDVRDEAQVEAYFARLSRVDVLIANAGLTRDGALANLGMAEINEVIAVNLRGVWLGLAALMPAMRRTGGGGIVITSSIAGLKGTPMLAAYGASKHAVVGLMKSAAIEGAPHGIRVNTVNPGPIDTRMMEAIDAGRGLPESGPARDAAPARIPLRRHGRAEEIAGMMLFLASDESGYCTGGTYVADGGTMAG